MDFPLGLVCERLCKQNIMTFRGVWRVGRGGMCGLEGPVAVAQATNFILNTGCHTLHSELLPASECRDVALAQTDRLVTLGCLSVWYLGVQGGVVR